MQDEKRKILEMVGEGKISQEDALRLLDALGEDGADPVGEAFQSTMGDLRGGQESGGQQEPGAAPAQEGIWEEMGEAAREVGQVLSQTAAATVDAISEGVQWAKGAVQKIPGMSVWWGDGQPEDGRQPYPCQEGQAPVDKLDIEWVNGPVEVLPWEGNYVNVTEYSAPDLEEGQRLEMTVTDGGTMRIRWTRDKRFWKGLLLSKQLLVQVPAGMGLEKLKVSNVSGSVRLDGLRGEDFNISTTSGRIWVAGLQGEGVKATSVSGDIHAESVQAESLRLGTTSGRIEALGFGAEDARMNSVSGGVDAYGNGESIEVKTVSGSAALQTERLPERVRMETVSGRIRLVLPPEAGFSAKYETMSGSFATAYPVSGDLSGKSGKVVHGSGDMEVHLHTLSGKIEICPAEK